MKVKAFITFSLLVINSQTFASSFNITKPSSKLVDGQMSFGYNEVAKIQSVKVLSQTPNSALVLIHYRVGVENQNKSPYVIKWDKKISKSNVYCSYQDPYITVNGKKVKFMEDGKFPEHGQAGATYLQLYFATCHNSYNLHWDEAPKNFGYPTSY